MAPRIGDRFLRSLSLTLFAAASLVAGPARAQQVIGSVLIETTEGNIEIALEEENPAVRDYARAFASLVRDRVLFHRSDKQIACDDTYCFYCTCVAGLCVADPNERTCEDDGFLVNDQTVPSAVLHAGSFGVDGGNHLVEIATGLGSLPPNVPGVFANNAMTVALVRDDDSGELTSEWVINVADNSELVRDNGRTFDDEQNGGAGAYFVIGQVLTGSDVVLALAGLSTTDARDEQSLVDDGTSSEIRGQLEQLPVIDAYDVEEDVLATFCTAGDSACLQPLCTTVVSGEEACEEPRCYALRPLTEEEQEIVDEGGTVPRFCAFPVNPFFPLIAEATPEGLTLLRNGLAPPESVNVLDYPNNPILIVDVRNENCPDDLTDFRSACDEPGVPTFLDVTTGGSAALLRVGDTSRATARDGAIDALELFEGGRARISGGSVAVLTGNDQSDAQLSSGTLDEWNAGDASTGLVIGGALGSIEVDGTSFVRIVGSGFEVDGSPASGAVTATSGLLSGTLLSGDAIAAPFARITAATATLHLLDAADYETSLPAIAITHPGNADDPATALGGVPYVFGLSQTEVTNAEYVEFLGSVAFSDPHGLYNTLMFSDLRGGILRTGANGNYRYQTVTGREDQPVVFVSLFDAVRYVNWLHNGRPRGSGDASTENGAYAISGATITPNPNPRFFIPSQDEWYKAAYFDPALGAYRDFPTASSTAPAALPPTRDVGNAANLATALGNADDPLADVGSYRFSGSAYGTLDQAGNVLEWVEDSLALRGGSWLTALATDSGRQASTAIASTSIERNDLGFRVPEPSAAALAAAALATLAGLSRRRRVSR